MESANTAGAGIEVQEVELFVGHDLEDMGVAADEEIGRIGLYEWADSLIIAAWIATDMGHPDIHAFAIEATV